jgi:hypothetical protein
MKKILLFVCIYLIHQNLNGQLIISDVISASGDQVQFNNLVLSYTVGESVVSSDNAEQITNNGFQQGNLIVTSVNELSNFSVEEKLIAFPNPTNGIVFLKRENNQLPAKADYIEIFTAESKVLEKILRPQFNQEINLSGLPKGVYFIRYVFESGSVQVFKIIKS